MDWVGFCYTALGIGGVVLTALSNRCNEKLGTEKTLLFLALLYICANCCMGVELSFGVVTAMLLRGVLKVLPIYVQAKVTESVPGSGKGMFIAIYMSVRAVAVTGASYLGASLYAVWPYLPYLTETILVAVWIGLFFLLRRKFTFLHVGKDTKTQPEKA